MGKNRRTKPRNLCQRLHFKRISAFVMTIATIVILSVCLLVYVSGYGSYENESTLELVHVIFRHGDRTPTRSELSPLNPYVNESFYAPYGYGQLTIQGIKTMYSTGKLLRQRYNNFLGPTWDIYKMHMRSTDRNRTMMSASAVLAGLWPPKEQQIWNQELPWYPIPYEYVPAAEDRILDPFTACSEEFWSEMNKLLNSPEVSQHLTKNYEEMRQIMSENMGLNLTLPDAFVYYFGFKIQEELELPQEEWVKKIYPQPIQSWVIDCYNLESGSPLLRKIMAGYHLKKILEDTKNKINGTLNPPGRKMFLYSAHDINLSTFLLSTGLHNVTSTPTYGSFISIELHKAQGVYGIKVIYQDFENTEPKILKLPDCEEFCEFDTFYELVESIIPKGDQECLGTSNS